MNAELVTPLTSGGVLQFGFRDGQAFVMQDDALLASLPVFPDELEAFSRVVPLQRAPCSVALSARQCDLHISWITVKRDVHYSGFHAAQSCVGCPGQPITLPGDEYYVLGDNVQSSSDSRFWGTVPTGLLLGRLTTIFWPLERWRFFQPKE